MNGVDKGNVFFADVKRQIVGVDFIFYNQTKADTGCYQNSEHTYRFIDGYKILEMIPAYPLEAVDLGFSVPPNELPSPVYLRKTLHRQHT